MIPVRIISDHVENRKKLAFGFDDYAETIAELISTNTNKTPFTLGISGKWGSGKTTLMKEVEKNLKVITDKVEENGESEKDFRRIKSVWFEAWKYKDEDEILAALIEVIINSIKLDNNLIDDAKTLVKENVKRGSTDLMDKVSKLGSSINYRKICSALSRMAINIDVTEFFNDVENEKQTTYEDFLSFYDIFTKTFDDVLWEYLQVGKRIKFKDKKAALVIFIDDLDRCPLPKIVQILETMKLFMDREGCIFVVGASKDIIEKAMKETEKYQEKDAEEFLEKIIQINFPLPKKTIDNADTFIQEIKGQLNIGDIMDEKIIRIIFPVLEYNPRRIIALFNDVSLQIGILNRSKNNLEFKKLLLWKTLEKYNKVFFNAIVKEKENYDSFVEDLRKYQNFSKDDMSEENKVAEQLNNPDWLVYLRDKDICSLIVEMDLNSDEYERLVSYSVRFEEDMPEIDKIEDFKVYLNDLEKSNIDAPKDYKTLVNIKGGKYDLDGFGLTEIESFAISKYPVTNKWFSEFVNQGGYQNNSYWSEEGLEYLKKNTVSEPEFWKQSKYSHPGKPVVGVSWYEAEAFCNWLKGQGDIEYRLPSEHEWQAAAGGMEKRTYPWGNEWDLRLCNNRKLDIGKTSMVGIFRNGNTPDGISDLAGNVWEWTSTQDSSDRVIRGGSWFIVAECCRVSYRSLYHPGLRDNDLGFRLAHSL